MIFQQLRFHRLRGQAVAAVLALAGTGCASTEMSSTASTAPVVSVIVGRSADNLLVGDSQQLMALPRDGKDRPLTGRDISWTSLNPGTATVSPTGVVSGHAPGTAQIVATSEGKSGTAVMTVWATRKDTAECKAPKPGWIWCDDFEKDRLSSYFEYAAIDGSFVRLPGVGYGGSVGMRARFSRVGQVQAGSLKLALGKTPSPYFCPLDAGTARYREIYWRHLVKLQAGWIGAGGDKMSRAQVLVIQVTSSLGFMPSPEREVVDPAREVLGLADRRDQLEVADALPDRDVQLVSEDSADEGLAVPQAPACLRQQIRVAGEQHSAE